MKDTTKTLICLVIVVAALVIYIVFACMPSWDELKEKFQQKKEAKRVKSDDNK